MVDTPDNELTASTPRPPDLPRPASPELTGGAGYTFEDGVAATYAAALLCENTAPGLPGRVVTKVAMQQGAFGQPLDDLIVDAIASDSSPMRLSLQVKRSVVISSAESNIDFRETIVRAHTTVVADGFRRDVDRVGLITGEISDASKRVFETLCEWARSHADTSTFIAQVNAQGVASDRHREIVGAVRSILSGRVDAAGLDEAAHTLLAHFVLMRFEMLNEGSVMGSESVARLREHLSPVDRHRADDLWRRILALVRVSQGHAASLDRRLLVARLNGAFRLAGAPSLRASLARLDEDARLALAEIANEVGGVCISRPRWVASVREKLVRHRFVQIAGQPGTGKSVVLRAVVEEQLRHGPVLFLKADRLVGPAWHQHAASLGLNPGFLESLLIELGCTGTPVLFIDGLDRVEVRHRAVVLDVINTIMNSELLGNWSLLATVRDTGMEPLRTWLPGKLLDNSGMATVDVSPFNDDEAAALSEQKPGLGALLFGAEQVRDIVRRPFFASVLCRRHGNDASAPTSEIDLATAWWKGGGYGAIEARAGHRRNALMEMAKAGAMTLGRRISLVNLDSDAVAELEADGIIKSVRDGHTVRFAHDIYFEWSFLQLLISQGDDWISTIQQAGEPPVLGRTVELLSQSELIHGEDWAKHLARIESANDLRSQWLRAWMLGPFAAPAFDDREEIFTTAMLADDAKRVSRLAVWFQAEKTRANKYVLDGALLQDSMSANERLLLADSLAWPSDLNSWRRCCFWLLRHIDSFPVQARPDVTSAFEAWQNAFADIANPLSQDILTLALRWLEDIEDRFHGGEYPRDRGLWDDLKRGEAEELETRLRAMVLRAGRAYSELAGNYLDRLRSMEHDGRHTLKQVYQYSPILSEVQAKRLVDLVSCKMRGALPVAVARRMVGSPYGRSHSDDWNRLSIDDGFGFFPASPLREPFTSLFQLAPDEARRLVIELSNHAITAWRQLHRLDYYERGTPIPLVLDFPWGRQIFWGDQKSYVWSRGTWGSHAVGSGLMALEAWAFAEVEKGRLVDDVIRDVLAGHKSAAALGVAVAVALDTKHRSDVTLPLVSNQRLWAWDLARMVNNNMGSSANLIGFSKPADIPHHRAVSENNARPSRKIDLRWLASIFVLMGNEIAEKAQVAIRSFPDNLPFDYHEQQKDTELIKQLTRTAEIWAEEGKPENYNSTPTPDGAGIIIEIDNPKAKGPDIDAINQRHAQIAEYYALLNWVNKSFEQMSMADTLTLKEALQRARLLDADDLFQGPHSILGPESDRRSAVAGVAAVVLCFGGDIESSDQVWAENVSLRAWLTQEETGDFFCRESILLNHPVLFASRGLAGLLRRQPNRQDALDALIQLTAHPYEQISVEALGGLLAAWEQQPEVAWIALELGIRLSFVFHNYVDTPEVQRARQARLVEDAVREALVRSRQPDVSHSELPDKPFMHSVIDFIVSIARRARLIGSGDRELNVHFSPQYNDHAEPVRPLPNLPAAWIKLPPESEPRRVQSRRGKYIDVEWRKPDIDLDWSYLPKVLGRVPVPIVMADRQRRDHFLAFCDEMIHWTIERLQPSWATGASGSGYEPQSTEMYEWRRELYRFLTRLSMHMEPQESIMRFVDPAMKTGDDLFASLMQPYISSLACNVMDEPAPPTHALTILNACVPRVLAHNDWERATWNDGRIYDSDLAEIVRSLFFISVERANGATRFANGNWADVQAIIPLADAFVNAVGDNKTVVGAFLTLCERAFDAYPANHFMAQVTTILGKQTGTPLGWRGTNIPGRLASLIQRFSEKEQPVPSEMAGAMLRALDALVDMGDRRAAAIQTSEVFKNVRTLPASHSA